jgi:hypothetical protein
MAITLCAATATASPNLVSWEPLSGGPSYSNNRPDSSYVNGKSWRFRSGGDKPYLVSTSLCRLQLSGTWRYGFLHRSRASRSSPWKNFCRVPRAHVGAVKHDGELLHVHSLFEREVTSSTGSGVQIVEMDGHSWIVYSPNTHGQTPRGVGDAHVPCRKIVDGAPRHGFVFQGKCRSLQQHTGKYIASVGAQGGTFSAHMQGVRLDMNRPFMILSKNMPTPAAVEVVGPGQLDTPRR